MSIYTDGREATPTVAGETPHPGTRRGRRDAAPRDEEQRLGPSRRPALDRLTWVLGGLGAVLLAALVSYVVQRVVNRLSLPSTSHVPAALATWGAVVALGSLALVFLSSRPPAWVRHAAVAAILSALATATVALPLQGTRYYLGGISIDQSFRTQFLTRLTDTPHLTDMNYAGIAPFYPSGWFWPAGRLAALSHLAGWQAYKPVALLTLAVVPVVVYWLWQRLAGARVGLCVGLVVIAAGLTGGADEPYSWGIAAVLPAVAALFWRTLVAERLSLGRAIGVGIVLGGAVSLYTLYAGFGVMTLVVLVLWSVAVAGAGQRLSALRRGVLTLVVAGVVAVLVALPVWTPYALAVLHGGGGSNVAARYLPPSSAELPAPMLEFSPWGVLLLLGAACVLWRLTGGSRQKSDALFPVGVVIVCCYLWYALSTAALALRTTLLAFRIETVLTVSLGIAGVLALRSLVHAAAARWPGWASGWWRPTAGTGTSRRSVRDAGRRVTVTAVVAAVLLGTLVLQQNGHDLDGEVTAAYNDPYPGGPNAKGQVLDDRDERWSGALAQTISRRSGRPADDLVVLTTEYGLLSVEPYFGFQQSTPHYANPLADYAQRTAYIDRLAAARTPAAFADLLDRSPWRAPTVFVLRREADGEHFQQRQDVFPADPNVLFRDAVFDPAVFAGWTSDEVGPFTVHVRGGS